VGPLIFLASPDSDFQALHFFRLVIVGDATR
jgi:hypothetical protein